MPLACLIGVPADTVGSFLAGSTGNSRPN